MWHREKLGKSQQTIDDQLHINELAQRHSLQR
jgi:hypothetical protein